MPNPLSSAGPDGSLSQSLTELRTLLLGYARQEIVQPLGQLGNALKFGILGALGMGVGMVFLTVAGLRLLQTEASGTFGGDMSPLPYLIVLFGLLLALAVMARLGGSPKARQDRAGKAEAGQATAGSTDSTDKDGGS